MPITVTSINSGSNGNCYYVGNTKEGILIDAGISCRETEKRMKLLGLSLQHVKAIFVSHEHTDHIKGIPAIAEKFGIPIYITNSTLKACAEIKRSCTRELILFDAVRVGDFLVTAFPKSHDAEDPCSFIIRSNDITIGVFTDIGNACEHVRKHFNLCNAAFLEANYDEVLLENGRYPYFLKNRIRGGKGHLSNSQALEIFLSSRPSFMTHLFLSHLSKDNNCPVKAKALFENHAGNTKIIVASRYQQTDLYSIEAGNELGLLTPVSWLTGKQMSLFESF